MGDTEYLISCVQMHPCVWDPTLPDYHNREKKEQAWLEICEAVLPRWATLSEQEKQIKRLDLKKKWSNCRDYYKKDMQRIGETPPPDRRKRRYVFAEHLHFLDKVIKGPEEPYEANDDEQKADDILIVEVEEEGDDTKKLKIKNKIAQADLKKNKSQEMLNDFLTITNKKSYKQYSDDEKYLLSFRSEMQQMTHLQKIDFKLGMMQLVKKIFQNESVENHPSSSHKYAHSSSYNTGLSPEYILDEDSATD